jgi:hypothetical protein
VPDQLFAVPTALNDLEVFDTATRTDGKIVGLGRRHDGSPSLAFRIALFRLAPDGALDDTFGTDGLLELSGLQSARS